MPESQEQNPNPTPEEATNQANRELLDAELDLVSGGGEDDPPPPPPPH